MQLSTAQGPIIVQSRNKTSPVEYDEDLVMMIGDYYHVSLELLSSSYTRPSAEQEQMDDNTLSRNILSTTDYAWMSEPQTILVNGNGHNPCDPSALKPGQLCSKDCGNHLQLVRPGTRYRVRIIAGSILSYYALLLEGHTMTLFEADVSRHAAAPIVLDMSDFCRVPILSHSTLITSRYSRVNGTQY